MTPEPSIRSFLARAFARRTLLKSGIGAIGTVAVASCVTPTPGTPPRGGTGGHAAHGTGFGTDDAPGILETLPSEAPPPIRGTKNPMQILTAFDFGRVSTLPGGKTLREYTLVAENAEIEVAPGVIYPAWTYNGSVPGPTLRCTAGDQIKIYFLNATTHQHTIHLHGVHPANMDGVFEQIGPGKSYVYEFEAQPYGLFPYHCHTPPVKKHIEKGLYGTLIVDPPGGRPPAREMVMVMNGFDTDVDGENEFYAVNSGANYFLDHPISIRTGELVRLYVVNMLEFDLINSFHLHGNMFKLFRTGTDLEHFELTDTVMMCQGERAVLEFNYRYPGKYMFHAHQSEFSELGWMGFFDVKA